MSHLDEGTLHALLDGEIASAELAGVERHLAECPVCRENLEEARSFRDEAFGMIEVLSPPAAADVLASPSGVVVPAGAPRPAAGGQLPAQAARRRPALLRWARPVAWAATTVLAVGLGYTIAQRDARPADRLLTEATPAEVDASTATKDEYRAEPAAETAPATPPAASGQAPDPAGGRDASAVAPVPRTEAARERQAAPPPRTPAAAAPAPVALKAADQLRKDEPAETRSQDAATSRGPDSVARVLQLAPGRVQDSAEARQLARRRLLDTAPIRLDEIVVTTPEAVAKRAANIAGAVGAAASSVAADSAIRRLGGAIRLVEGLTPLRYEIVDSVIRVAYQTSYGLLFLDQWREDGVLRHRLVAPRTAPADSLAAWEERIR